RLVRGTVLARGVALLALRRREPLVLRGVLRCVMGSQTEVHGRTALAERVAQRVHALRHEGPTGIVGHGELHGHLAGPGVQVRGPASWLCDWPDGVSPERWSSPALRPSSAPRCSPTAVVVAGRVAALGGACTG